MFPAKKSLAKTKGCQNAPISVPHPWTDLLDTFRPLRCAVGDPRGAKGLKEACVGEEADEDVVGDSGRGETLGCVPLWPWREDTRGAGVLRVVGAITVGGGGGGLRRRDAGVGYAPSRARSRRWKEGDPGAGDEAGRAGNVCQGQGGKGRAEAGAGCSSTESNSLAQWERWDTRRALIGSTESPSRALRYRTTSPTHSRKPRVL